MPIIRSSGFPPRNAPNSIRRPWRVSQDRSGETSSNKTFRELLFNVSIDRGFLSVSGCLWRDITAGDNREGPSAIFVTSRHITDKGMRTGGCYLHEARIDRSYRSSQSRRPKLFFARSLDRQVAERSASGSFLAVAHGCPDECASHDPRQR